MPRAFQVASAESNVVLMPFSLLPWFSALRPPRRDGEKRSRTEPACCLVKSQKRRRSDGGLGWVLPAEADPIWFSGNFPLPLN